LTFSIPVRQVWMWDGQEQQARVRTLVISKNQTENNITYSVSHATPADTSVHRFAYMQAQRYWVERAFQDAKREGGMSDYQVRKWRGWYHHMAFMRLAMSFLVRERIRHTPDYPLLSCRDVRILIIA